MKVFEKFKQFKQFSMLKVFNKNLGSSQRYTPTRVQLNKAFTLAEVLITLGIIGVVAAITIPTLIQSQQDKANAVAFKKMYSNLYNVLKQVNQENGGSNYLCYRDKITYIYMTSECTIFWKEFLSKFRSVTKCSGGLANSCQPQYKNYAEVIAAGGEAAPSNATGLNVTNNKMSYTLSDGTMIYSYNADLNEYGLFIVDTNGFKKPNKWGYDVYMLGFMKDEHGVLITDAIWMKEKGGKKIADILFDQ